jgi:hypothetical protein
MNSKGKINMLDKSSIAVLSDNEKKKKKKKSVE